MYIRVFSGMIKLVEMKLVLVFIWTCGALTQDKLIYISVEIFRKHSSFLHEKRKLKGLKHQNRSPHEHDIIIR